MTPRANTRLKIWLVVLGVFILGCVTGAALDSVYRIKAGDDRGSEHRGGRRDRKEKIFEEMKRDLNLNEQQATEIRAILDATRNEYRQLKTEVEPRYDAIRQQGRARIRALLNPEQQQRFDAEIAERDAKRNGERKNGRGREMK
jgi:Spy/CpxP family protein refolding chaperone